MINTTEHDAANYFAVSLAFLFLYLLTSVTPGQATSSRPQGEWSPVYAWPDVAVHLHLLPNGKILTFSDDDHDEYHTAGTRLGGFSKAFVVDIPHGGAPAPDVLYVPNTTTNMFCSGHTFLPDGRLIVAGGHVDRDHHGSRDVNILEFESRYVWHKRADTPMQSGRWYPSVVKLSNGEIVVLGGTQSGPQTHNPLPEVWRTSSGGGWRGLTSAMLSVPWYPYLHLAPNGKVLMVGPSQTTRYLDAAGAGAWTAGPRRRYGDRRYGASVAYEQGKILMFGGANPPTRTAEIIDLNASAPAWRAVGELAQPRRHVTGVLLPDGQVLAIGGTSARGNDASGAVLTPELWTPSTGRWTAMASMQTPRLYHSTAMLLPDGRVLAAGGGRGSGGTDYENAEIFAPPYLFDGPRPTITSAPTAVAFGRTFVVNTPDATSITKAVLISLASVTHTVNMSQHVNQLGFQATAGGLRLTAPSNRRYTPPGHYMLFLLNAQGVPSIAPIIRIRP